MFLLFNLIDLSGKYFAYSGLNTRIDQLSDGLSWAMVFLVIAVACFGKIVGCTLAGKFTGLNWRDSFSIGILMNTKGLVEIIVLNLGREAKVINDKVFTVMVVMALFTTFMTVPLISIIYPTKLYLKKESNPGHLRNPSAMRFEDHDDIESVKLKKEIESTFSNDLKILLCLPDMTSVSPMMALTQVIQTTPVDMTVNALRLIPLGERNSTVMVHSLFNLLYQN